jgi:hypothetical protein
MPIEALAWSLFLLLSPTLASRLWPSLQERHDPFPFDVEIWAPWIHSFVLPYLAVILGSVSGRKIGLYGQTAEEWFVGLLACSIGMTAAVIFTSRLDKRPNPEVNFVTSLLEETRWAFYRGAVALWLPGMFVPLLGFGLALIEFALKHMDAFGRHPPSSAGSKVMMRAAFSSLLFFATGNFWMTAGTQLLLNIFFNKRNSH